MMAVPTCWAVALSTTDSNMQLKIAFHSSTQNVY